MLKIFRFAPRHALLTLGVVGALAIGGPGIAQAQPGGSTATAPKTPQDVEKNMAEAKSRYRAGLTLYDDGAFDAARVQFERAYELAPSYKILYNIGLVYKQLNEFVGSLKALQRYLAEGGTEVPDDRRAEVTKLIETLKPIIASATVVVNMPNAEIAVDDAVVGKSPMLDPIFLNPGRRKISSKLDGRLPDAKVITVASGDKVEVQLNLAEPPKTVVRQGADIKPLVAWIVTGAFAAGAAITGILTLSASSDLSDLKKKRNPDTGGTLSQDLSDQRTKMRTLGTISDILTIGTVVSAGVAVYFTFFNSSKEKDKDPGKITIKTGDARPATGTTARFMLTPTGAGIVGSF